MNVLLINPPTRLGRRSGNHPYGLSYIARSLVDEGHRVHVLDVNAFRWPREEVVERIRAIDFDMVGLGGMVTVYNFQKWVAGEIKRIRPGVPIVAGGAGATSIPSVLLETTDVDVAVVGEGDYVVKELAQALGTGGDVSKVPGIWYKHDGKVYNTAPLPRIDRLDDIPFPAWDLFPMEIYITNPQASIVLDILKEQLPLGTEVRQMGLIKSRGCPFPCKFCYVSEGKLVREHSVEYTVKQVKVVREKYGVNIVHFADNLFIINRKWVFEFCEAIAAENLGIKFFGTGRADMMEPDLLAALKRAGFFVLNFGIETGSDKMLKAMKKNSTVEKNTRGLRLTAEAGIVPVPSFIIGYPGETPETVKETIQFCKAVNLPFVPGSFFATPYPGADLWDIAKSMGRIGDEVRFIERLGDASDLTMNLTDMSDEQLVDLKTRFAHEVRRHYLLTHGQYWQYLKERIAYWAARPISLWRYYRRLGLRRTLCRLETKLVNTYEYYCR